MPFTIDQLRAMANQATSSTLPLVELLEALRNDHEEYRAWVCDALHAVEHVPDAWRSDVLNRCLDPDPTVALWACKLAVRCNQPHADVQAALCQALKQHADRQVRIEAGISLLRLPQLAPAVHAQIQQAANQLQDARLQRHLARYDRCPRQYDPSSAAQRSLRQAGS